LLPGSVKVFLSYLPPWAPASARAADVVDHDVAESYDMERVHDDLGGVQPADQGVVVPAVRV
jgi:hypothetical protein